MVTKFSSLKAIEAARSALYAREAAGQPVKLEEWLELGDAQSALLPTTREGYYR